MGTSITPNTANALPALAGLLREIVDSKRIRTAGVYVSLAERSFLRSWARLLAGESVDAVALRETAHAVASARLAGIDARVLILGGVRADERRAILQRGFDSVAAGIPSPMRGMLRDALSAHPLPGEGLDGDEAPDSVPSLEEFDFGRLSGGEVDNEDAEDAAEVAPPEFALLLAQQPRAGATRVGHARMVLEPAENHAEHCAVVAVGSVLASGLYGADYGSAFLTGLAHHLHNAYLPDAGDAGDALLGEQLRPLMTAMRAHAMTQIPAGLQASVGRALEAVYSSETPEGRAFQTADSLDRVLEMEWHARAASFTLATALRGMEIIHPGPVQQFQQAVIESAGLA